MPSSLGSHSKSTKQVLIALVDTFTSHSWMLAVFIDEILAKEREEKIDKTRAHAIVPQSGYKVIVKD